MTRRISNYRIQPPNFLRTFARVSRNKLSLSVMLETRELSEIAVLSALFVIASVIPVSTFIGGAGFITLGIVLVPVIARMLRPWPALISGLVGALAMYALQLATAPIFGPISILIPMSGILLGSVGFHHRLGCAIPWGYVLFGAVYYFSFSRGTLLWLAPYLIVILSLPIVITESKFRLPLLCLYSTLCELTTMNIASIGILRLPGPLWSVITPLMFFERTVATAGSYMVISGIIKAMPRMGEQ